MSKASLNFAVIVAAGRGTRAGGTQPKQWQPLLGKRVLDQTIAALQAHPGIGGILLVLHEDDMDLAPSGIRCVAGGASRSASVRAGLEALVEDAPQLVLIHDVARPCVPTHVIENVVNALGEAEAAAPGLPVTDALWIEKDGKVAGTQDRANLFRAQTPQGFHYQAILGAHRSHPDDAADDVAIARAAGLDVVIVPGDEENLKITYPADFARAARILEARHGHQTR